MSDTTAEFVDALQSAREVYDRQGFEAIGADSQPWSDSTLILLSGLVLAFMVIVLILSTILLFRKQATAPEVLKVFGVLSIIGLSTLLLITGYGNEQLTPIVGLFGAISGYLLGKDRAENSHGRSDAIGSDREGNTQPDGEEDSGSST